LTLFINGFTMTMGVVEIAVTLIIVIEVMAAEKWGE
jgi:hypothetical protein